MVLNRTKRPLNIGDCCNRIHPALPRSNLLPHRRITYCHINVERGGREFVNSLQVPGQISLQIRGQLFSFSHSCRSDLCRHGSARRSTSPNVRQSGGTAQCYEQRLQRQLLASHTMTRSPQPCVPRQSRNEDVFRVVAEELQSDLDCKTAG